MTWRMLAPCVDCPFNTSGLGLRLRRSLKRGRWREITAALRRGSHFICHKTTRETGDGSNLMCAGAMRYQRRYGITSQLEQICRRLDRIRRKVDRIRRKVAAR